jgi:hypothetical protein
MNQSSIDQINQMIHIIKQEINKRFNVNGSRIKTLLQVSNILNPRLKGEGLNLNRSEIEGALGDAWFFF